MQRAWWGFWLMVIILGCAQVGHAYPAWSLMAARTALQPDSAAGVKYGPQFGNAWQAALKAKETHRWLDCVIRLSTPPTDKDIAQLKATGFQPRSIVHDIVTGRIQVRDVKRFLKLPLVVSVEGGGMGGPKQTRGLK